MATHSSTLAWRIPWTEEPGGYSLWNHNGSDITEPPTFSLSLSKYFGVKERSVLLSMLNEKS